MTSSLGKTPPTLQETLIFLHLPKTGGITLDHILASYFPRDVVYRTLVFDFATKRPKKRIGELKQLPEEDRARIRYIELHPGPFGIHEFLPQPCRYITLLRDPIDRIISSYFFHMGNPDLRRIIAIDESKGEFMTLQDYAATRQNVQTRMIAGIAGDSLNYSGTLPSDIVAIAQKNIQEHFSLTGLLERFDESLLLFEMTFGWGKSLYLKRNVTRERPSKEDLPNETLRLLSKYNELDIELYENVRNDFERQIRQQHLSFHLDLQIFRIRNRVYGRIIGNKVYRWIDRTFPMFWLSLGRCLRKFRIT